VRCAILLLVALCIGAPAWAEGSLERLARAVSRHPDDRDLSLAYTRALETSGRREEAVARLRTHLERWPGHPADGWLILGRWLYGLGRPGDALVTLARAVDERPDDAEATLLLGLALRDVGRVAEAEARFRRASELAPELAGEALLLAGLARLELGDARGGDALLRQVIALDPGAEAARSARLVLSGDAAPPARRLRAEAYAGLEFDSNVSLESDEIGFPGTGDPADLRASYGTLIRGRVWSGERSRVELGARYDGTSHFDLDEYDTDRFTGFLTADREISPRLSLRLDAWGGSLELDSDAYLVSGSIRPSLFAALGERVGVLRLYADGERLRFEDDPLLSAFERTGWRYGGGIEQYVPLPVGEERGWLTLGAGFMRHDTEADRDPLLGFAGDYDHDRWNGRVRGRATLPWGVRAVAEVGFDYERYAHRNAAGLLSELNDAPRRDRVLATGLTLTRSLSESVDVELGWRFQDRDSNVRVFSHDRHVVGLSLRAHTP
jgi:tetratricopeptide (TPR) repeat protein